MRSKEEISKELFDLIFCEALSCSSDKEAGEFLRNLSPYFNNFGVSDEKSELPSKIKKIFNSSIMSNEDEKECFEEAKKQVFSLMGIKTMDVINISGSYIMTTSDFVKNLSKAISKAT